ncbi:MAG: hypothetical protein ABI675_17365 [Chitinophagaceae bacterium]
MFRLNSWDILGIIAIVCLILSSFSIGRKAIWGGLTIGVIAGLIIGVISLIVGNGFNWWLVKNVIIVAILVGAFFEIFGWLATKKKKSA